MLFQSFSNVFFQSKLPAPRRHDAPVPPRSGLSFREDDALLVWPFGLAQFARPGAGGTLASFLRGGFSRTGLWTRDDSLCPGFAGQVICLFSLWHGSIPQNGNLLCFFQVPGPTPRCFLVAEPRISGREVGTFETEAVEVLSRVPFQLCLAPGALRSS